MPAGSRGPILGDRGPSRDGRRRGRVADGHEGLLLDVDRLVCRPLQVGQGVADRLLEREDRAPHPDHDRGPPGHFSVVRNPDLADERPVLRRHFAEKHGAAAGDHAEVFPRGVRVLQREVAVGGPTDDVRMVFSGEGEHRALVASLDHADLRRAIRAHGLHGLRDQRECQVTRGRRDVASHRTLVDPEFEHDATHPDHVPRADEA